MKWIDWPSIVGAEVRELVEPRLLRAPVVLVAPVLDQLAQVADRDAVLPAGVVDLVGEAGRSQAVGEVVEDQVADVDRRTATASSSIGNGILESDSHPLI